MEWETIFKQIHAQHDFSNLKSKLEVDYETKTIFPKREDIYNAFKFTPFDHVKVVIVGQDPYHGVNQAHGLAFSVKDGNKTPPSLRNMYQELESDLQIKRATPELTGWAKEGVLLLNNVLTVEEKKANAHKNYGWQVFTSEVIRAISEYKMHVVFILWGSHAQKLLPLIDQTKHHVILNVHPSPLSAYRGFFGSKPYSETNAYLMKHNISPINWAREDIS